MTTVITATTPTASAPGSLAPAEARGTTAARTAHRTSNRTTAQWQQADAAHFLHPFTDFQGLARKGVKVIYVPGNHDEAARDFIGHRFGDVLVMRDAIHETADGRRFLVTHGDEFDGVLRHARWLAFVGDWSYRTLLSPNH